MFRAEKRDIYLDLPVTPWEAALGSRVTVPTLGGKVDVKVPPGSQTGRKLRLKGRGLPGKPPGDQYVILAIMAPPAGTRAARELYERMAREMPMNPRQSLGV
jgi:curved DNA-binding protein